MHDSVKEKIVISPFDGKKIVFPYVDYCYPIISGGKIIWVNEGLNRVKEEINNWCIYEMSRKKDKGLYCPVCGQFDTCESEEEACEDVWMYHRHYCQECGCSFKILRKSGVNLK